MRKNISLLILVTLFCAMFVQSNLVVFSQTNTPVSTPTPIPELVAEYYWDENCETSCFLGLVVGESISLEVLNTLQAHRDILTWALFADENTEFEPESGVLLEGTYQFFWSNTSQEGAYSSFAHIEDGLLTRLEIHPPYGVTLSQALDVFPNPDLIVAVGMLANGNINFIYEEQRLAISLYIPRSCTLANFAEETLVHYLLYTPEEDFDFSMFISQNITEEVWNEWLTSDSDQSCIDALTRYYFPTTPTPSATP